MITKKFITEIAYKSGKTALDNLYKKKTVSYKKNKEIVTSLDKKIEKDIVKKIKSKYLTHNIIGEEFNYKKSDSKYSWVIDPIDGTENYVKGYPHFNTSIAVLYDDEPILAVTYNPCTEQMFYAKKGKGAYLNNKRLSVTDTKNIKDAFVEYSETKTTKASKILNKLFLNFHKLRLTGSTALSLAYVAAGFLDARINQQ